MDKRLRSVVRCIVQVLTDPVSGYYIVHVGQDELPVEESTQHLDFALDKQVSLVTFNVSIIYIGYVVLFHNRLCK